tara:strand:+ start:11677 stop:12210 length:534 start_codon:yes stop_codon:yes gene_type:complete
VFKGIKSAIAVVVSLVVTSSAYGQDDNPFVYKDRQQVQAETPVAVASNSDLSDAQREQVLALLTDFLSDSGLNSGDSIYTVGDGKRYFVVPSEDKFVGEISGKYIVFDSSRNKNVYVDSSKYDDVISQEEHDSLTTGQKESISEVGEKLIQGITNSATMPFQQIPAKPSITIGNKKD